jgi:hypothetical protein
MAGLFGCSLVLYGFVRQATRAEGITTFAITVFNNSVVMAPSVLLLAALQPARSVAQYRWRGACVLASIAVGLVAVVSCATANNAALRAWSTIIGFLSALLPAAFLMIHERMTIAVESRERVMQEGHL